jgi:hypothetical protein
VIESTQTLLDEHSKTAIASVCTAVPLVELMPKELIGKIAKKRPYPESARPHRCSEAGESPHSWRPTCDDA